MVERKVRVRFAPSPTGPLHIGGVRTALYNYLFAKQHGGDLIFRIEDTDSNRFVPGAEEYIIESFNWLGIKFDEGVSFGGNYGPYRQSERRDIYKKYVQVLLDNGKAYLAFDTPEELDAKRQEIENFQYDAKTRMMMRNSLTLSKEEVDALIETVGLSDVRNELATSRPYGKQRRLEIARALATEPKLLLLDEPAAGMNPQETVELTKFIGEIRDQFHVTILLIEHHMDLVMDISERIYVLDFGSMIASGTPAEIQSNEKVIDAYLGVTDDA